MGITTKILSKSDGSLIRAGDPVSFKYISILSPSNCDATSIKYLEKVLNNLDLISNFYILKFDNQKIYFRIIYNGSPKIFLKDMNKNNFDLIMENNIWTVK